MDATEELGGRRGGVLVLGRYRLGPGWAPGGSARFRRPRQTLDRPVAVKVVPVTGRYERATA